MADLYAEIDRSVLLNYLFYPRRQHSKARDGVFDLAVNVTENITIVCRAYPSGSKTPWILFFHGNGEVVSDYDGIAPLYQERGLNLLVVDYRGYGASGGSPTFTDMIKDAGKVFETVSTQLEHENESGKWFVMGRSLGSISALELAASYSDRLSGIIIESGFISVDRLIKHLGMPSPGDLSELEKAYRQIAEEINLPALVIHGQRDRLVPPEQGNELFQALGSEEKSMVMIPGADHNDIMFVDSQKYMDAIAGFVLK